VVAEHFWSGAAAAVVSKLPSELAEILQLVAAQGADAVLAPPQRAVEFRRWPAAEIRSSWPPEAPPPALPAPSLSKQGG